MGTANFYVSAYKKDKGYFIKHDTPYINLGIPKDSLIGIGIDQSSSSTGIYILDLDFKFHIIGHVERRGQMKDRFYQELYNFFLRNVKDVTVGLFVVEQHTKIRKFDRALPVLAELRGHINSWKMHIDEFKNIPDELWTSIPPGTWKSAIVDKSKGTNRFNDKREVALDIVDMFPEFGKYFNSVPRTSDYDGFDAAGILHGYIRTNYNSEGQVIAGVKDYRGDILIFIRCFPATQSNIVAEVEEDFKVQKLNHGLEVVQYNGNKTYYDNVLMAASSRNCTATFVSDRKALLAFKWMHDFDIDNSLVMMVICRANGVKKVEEEYLRTKYKVEEYCPI